MMSFVPFVALLPTHRGVAVASNEALVRRLQEGDNAALAELYRREAAAVYRYALALCGNAAWSADATQEAFVALATRPLGYDATRGPLGAYLAGVARHALGARWCEGRALQPLPEDDEAPLPVDEPMASTCATRWRKRAGSSTPNAKRRAASAICAGQAPSPRIPTVASMASACESGRASSASVRAASTIARAQERRARSSHHRRLLRLLCPRRPRNRW